MAAEWTDETKTEIVNAYKDSNPSPENTMDVVRALAEDYEVSPNAVRMLLSKAGVYVKKEAASSSSTTEDKPKRVSKEAAISELVQLIEDSGQTPDMEIISKLTGKAAKYFTSVLTAIKQ